MAEEPIMDERFSDCFNITINDWSCSVDFGHRAAKPGEKDEHHTRMRMSLPQGKALALILLKVVRQYESTQDMTIDLPLKVIEGMGIGRDDWG